MQVDQTVAREVKERLLAMCTHDCAAFLRFRALIEDTNHSPAGAAQMDSLLYKLNAILRYCGAGTNEDYPQ